MTPKARELETLALTMFAAVPLYFTQAISAPPLIAFHIVMLGIAIRVASGKGPELIPAAVMRAFAVAYMFFYVVDAVGISRNAIAASTHLILFIAAYQPIESVRTRNQSQRLLTTSLLFLASIATATHLLVLPFVIAFTFLMFRQLMRISHDESLRDVDAIPAYELPTGRAAAFYLCGTTLVGLLLFPLLPRVRNPLLPGMAGGLSNASTGLSETIDFNQPRTSVGSAGVVTRVWMSQEAVPFFTPLRLRGAIYDRFNRNEWRQSRREFYPIDVRDNVARIARPSGFTRRAVIQQRFIVGTRLFLPTGTYEISGLPQVVEAPTRDIFMTWMTRGDLINYDIRIAREIRPTRTRPIPVTDYTVTPPVALLARQIVGDATDPQQQARRIEQHMSTKFTYVADPASIGRGTMTVDDFLLKERRGHCEYFAAGMVALLSSLNVPARIVGGFYGGQLNPLTGYFVVRRQDAHAWVEVWDGEVWRTFDPTPVSLRPGNAQQGLLRVYASAIGDSITYFWDRYILTFGLGDQIALAIEVITRVRTVMSQLRSGAAATARDLLSLRFLLTIATLVAISFGIFGVRRFRRPMAALLTEHLRSLGIHVNDAMTMEEALERLRIENPDAADALRPLIAMYEEERFSNHADAGRASAVRRALREMRV
jgi:transglutaminase-like putative cysteine protease